MDAPFWQAAGGSASRPCKDVGNPAGHGLWWCSTQHTALALPGYLHLLASIQRRAAYPLSGGTGGAAGSALPHSFVRSRLVFGVQAQASHSTPLPKWLLCASDYNSVVVVFGTGSHTSRSTLWPPGVQEKPGGAPPRKWKIWPCWKQGALVCQRHQQAAPQTPQAGCAVPCARKRQRLLLLQARTRAAAKPNVPRLTAPAPPTRCDWHREALPMASAPPNPRPHSRPIARCHARSHVRWPGLSTNLTDQTARDPAAWDVASKHAPAARTCPACRTRRAVAVPPPRPPSPRPTSLP